MYNDLFESKDVNISTRNILYINMERNSKGDRLIMEGVYENNSNNSG